MTVVTAAHRTALRCVARVMARVGALVGVVLMLGSLVAVVGAGPAAAAGCDAPIGDAEIRVSIVVDSDATGLSSDCLVVPTGTTGFQLLARRAALLGRSAPRYAQSGLLCAIDGFPTSGCGDRSSGGFAYWAYFNGTSGSWVYGNYNPFIRRLSDGDVEGWRFVGGGGDAADPPPRTAPPRLGPAVRAVVPPAAVDPAPSNGGGTVSTQGGRSATGTVDAVPTDDVVTTMVPSSVVGATIDGEAVDGSLTAASRDGGSSGSWVLVTIVALVVLALAVGAFTKGRSTR